MGLWKKEVPVKDPDTGEMLGHLDREKIRVKIVQVNPKFSIGKTYQTYLVNVGGTFPDFTQTFRRVLEPRREVTRVRTSRTDDSVNLEPMGEKSSFVKVGDPVVQLEGESDSLTVED